MLAAIPYSDNDVYLHTDEALMPRRKATWASWNFLGRSADAGDKCAGSREGWRASARQAAGCRRQQGGGRAPGPTPGPSNHHRRRAAVCVSYWANRLQPLPAGAPNLFVTLNPISPPAKDKTFRRLTLSHPVFSFASDAAQRALPAAQARGSHAWQGEGWQAANTGGCQASCHAPCTAADAVRSALWQPS